jgi:ketosteroid isomerase-like protein
MTRPKLILAALAGTLALAPAAILTAAPPDEERRAAHAVEAWHAALADRDPERACALLTPEARRTFTGDDATWLEPGGCKQVLTLSAALLTDRERALLRDLEVGDVVVDGDRATAALPETHAVALVTRQYARSARLRRLAGRWLLDVEAPPAPTRSEP